MSDILQPLFWLTGFTAIASLIFRRVFWLRIICVLLSLLAVFFGIMRLSVSPRMAVDRLQREGKPWSEAFRDGSSYTYKGVYTAFPVFLLSAAVLATLALVPPKPPTNESDNSRNS